jgi:hypothetical protein
MLEDILPALQLTVDRAALSEAWGAMKQQMCGMHIWLDPSHCHAGSFFHHVWEHCNSQSWILYFNEQ